MDDTINSIFRVSPAVRYVALYRNGRAPSPIGMKDPLRHVAAIAAKF